MCSLKTGVQLYHKACQRCSRRLYIKPSRENWDLCAAALRRGTLCQSLPLPGANVLENSLQVQGGNGKPLCKAYSVSEVTYPFICSPQSHFPDGWLPEGRGAARS